jgi:signal transduction histidine kinase
MREEFQQQLRGAILPEFRDAGLERDFRDHLFDSRHRLIRNSLLLALCLFVILEPLAGAWSPREVPAIEPWTRWLVDVPLLLFALWTIQFSANPALVEKALLICLAAVFTTNVFSLWAASPEIRPFYTAASIQIMLFGFMLVGLRFKHALLCISLVLGLALLASAALAISFDSWADFRASWVAPVLLFLGLAFSGYFLDVSTRSAFLLNRMVAESHARQLELERERNAWLRIGNDYLNHEIKNAMLGISSSLGLLQRHNHNEELNDYLSRAEQSTAFMRRLLNEVSVSTNLESALSGLELEQVDLEQLLQAKLEEYREIYPEHDFELCVRDSPRILCDVDRMVQVLDKLVDNAVAHATRDAPVQVTLDTEGANALVSVADIGDPLIEAGPELFDPFVTRRSRSTDSGFGLGLYVVKRIVEAHGGTVSCAPLREPDGAVFTVALPQHRAQGA